VNYRRKIALHLTSFAISTVLTVVLAQSILPWLIQVIGFSNFTIMLLLVGLGVALGLIYLIVSTGEDQGDE
jgi:hypothetical protein